MEYYTVKQLAERFKVTQQAVHKELKKEKYQKYVEKRNINSHSTVVVNVNCLNKLEQHFLNLKVDRKHFRLIQNNLDQLKSTQINHLNQVGSTQNNPKQLRSTQFNQLNQPELASNVSRNQDTLNNLIEQLKENNKNLKHTISILENETQQLHEELQHEQELHLMDQKQVKELENKIKEFQEPRQTHKESLEKNKKHWWKWWKN